MFARRKAPASCTSATLTSSVRYISTSQDSDEKVEGRIHCFAPLFMFGGYCCGEPKRWQANPSSIKLVLLLALLLLITAYLLFENKTKLSPRSVSGGQTIEKLPKGESTLIRDEKFEQEARYTSLPSNEGREKDYQLNEGHHDNSCVWSPVDQSDCRKLLVRRVGAIEPKSKKRWLFFGDSTVAQFWQISSLENILVDLAAMKWNERDRINNNDRNCITKKNVTDYHCEAQRINQHCDLNEPFGLAQPAVWQPPNVDLGEGPLMIVTTNAEGKELSLPETSEMRVSEQQPERNNAACLECRNCQSSFLSCHLVQNQQHSLAESESSTCNRNQDMMRQHFQLPLHGGYFAMPFARDVVIQSPDARTTQENIVTYIQKQHQERQPAVCVVRVGLHDMALPNITISKFTTNVRWYLNLLLTSNRANSKNYGVCLHVIWLQNTAPLWKDDIDIPPGSPPHHIQTVKRVRAYDVGVYDMISTSPLQDYVTTIDMFEASKDSTHSDNIHMNSAWNRALGMFFVKVATKMASPEG